MTQVPAAMVDSFTQKWNYDVFLSFRGADTRNKFLGHLYAELTRRGIYTFKDDKELKRGDEISPALLKAIGESRISIIIFSKHYASSTWCLDELVHILKCRREKKQFVLPVFYDVEPTEIRKHQSGSFGLAMADHGKRFQSNMEKVDNWKQALKEAADLAGLEFQDGSNEYSFLQGIVDDVSSKLNRELLDVADHPVGLKFHILKVKSLLEIGSSGDDHVCMIGIHGIGGIGKTTLAKAVYNLIAGQFEGGTSFLANIRETSIPQLQERLLSDIVDDKNIKLQGNSSQGISFIKRRLGRKKVLLVLDDVDRLDQLKELAGKRDWFGGGSRIIITTRNKRLLVNHNVNKTYEMKLLNDHEALQLLSWRAFKSRVPATGYVDISKCVVDYSKGLPLALEVLGSELFDRSIHEWESVLRQCERNLKEDIFSVLRRSYDELHDNEKKLFLDIACFFHGEAWESVEKTYHACSFPVDICMGKLEEKSLVTIDQHNILRMHDLIRGMGREIVQQESTDPMKRSRLWFHEEVLQVIKDNMGTEKIEGIKLDLPERREVKWNRKAFKEMKNLRIIIIRNAYLKGGPKYLPDNLRLLEWQEYPSQYLPDDFREEKLVILRLTYSRFMLEEMKEKFENLMIMNLNGGKFLEVPDLSGIPHLKELHLDGCLNLTEIHASVGLLEKLVMLSAERCTNLYKFPGAIRLTFLKHLNLRSCNKLDRFPNVLGKMENISLIDMCYTAIKELPSSIENLIGLQELRLSFCKRLKDLPINIYKLENLSSLELEGCQEVMPSCNLYSKFVSNGILRLTMLNIRNCDLSDKDLPPIFSCFRYLKMLDLSGNNFIIFPKCIIELVSLKCLRLNNCKQLKFIPREILPSLSTIDAFNCTSLSLELSSSSLSQEFKEIRVPGIRIPEWFHPCCEGETVSFWVQKKLPEIIVAFVLAVKNVDLHDHPGLVSLLVNDIKVLQTQCSLMHKLETDHVWLFDLRNHLTKEEPVNFETFLEDGWNHLKVSFQSHTLTANWCGVHVIKNGSNSEDVFTSSDPQNSGMGSQIFRPSEIDKEQVSMDFTKRNQNNELDLNNNEEEEETQLKETGRSKSGILLGQIREKIKIKHAKKEQRREEISISLTKTNQDNNVMADHEETFQSDKMKVEVELEQVPINFTGRYQDHNEHQLTDQEDEAHCENEKNKLAELKDQKEKEVTAIKNKISASGLAWDRHADKENNKIVEEVIMGLQFQDLAERNQTNDLKIVEVTKECEAEHQSESFDDGWASIEDQNLENYELEEVKLKEKETKEYEMEVELKLHKVNFKIEGNIPVMPQDFPEIFPPGSADDAVVVYRTRDSLEPCTVDDCDSVVDLLEGYGLKLDVRNTRQSYYKKELLKLLHGCMILPSVFLKGRYVGGLNEVMNLHNSGQLSKILIRATYMEKKKYETEVELKLHKVNSKIEGNILVKLQDFPEIFPPGSADDAVVVYTTRDSLEPCTMDDCDSVVDLLEGYGLKLDVRNTTRSYYEKELLKLLHGFMVLPSVYVKGRYLGGLNEVKKLHNSGQLSNILISTGIYMEKNHNV